MKRPGILPQAPSRRRAILWFIPACILGVSAALFPSPTPTTVAARPITFHGQGSVHALAFVAEGAPVIPAALLSWDGFQGVENYMARQLGFRDPEMQSAREQAWLAVRLWDTGSMPTAWVHRDPTSGRETNRITCQRVIQRDEVSCVSRHPIQRLAFAELIKRFEALSVNGESTTMGDVDAQTRRGVAPTPNPRWVDGRFGHPVGLPIPSGFLPVIESSSARLPRDDGLGLWAGRSVGLAYALAYLEQAGGPLSPHGMRVAATGTVLISPDGKARVGGIAGLREKVQGAEAAGVDVVFIPATQMDEAAQIASPVQIVGVSSPFAALGWLCARGSSSAYCDSALAT
jgi:hypothetical protein